MSKDKKKKSKRVTYDDATKKKMASFMKTHNNRETKREFGCSTHFVGALRSELGMSSPAKSKSDKPAKAGKPGKKPSKVKSEGTRPTVKQALGKKSLL